MNNHDCILERNIPSLIDSPEDKNLQYLVEHIGTCRSCDVSYKEALSRRRILETWIPEASQSSEFDMLVSKRIKVVSKQVIDQLDGTLLQKRFIKDCFLDFLSIFKNKKILMSLSFFGLFLALLYY